MFSLNYAVAMATVDATMTGLIVLSALLGVGIMLGTIEATTARNRS